MPTNLHRCRLPALLVLLLLVHPPTRVLASDPALTLSAAQTAAQVGRSFSVTCSLPSDGCARNYTAADVRWTAPNGTLLGGGSADRLTSVNGTLNCLNSSLADAGVYNCTLDPCSLSTTVQVVVYEMPSYAVSLAIIFSIDGGLAILAGILCVLSLVVTKKSSNGIV